MPKYPIELEPELQPLLVEINLYDGLTTKNIYKKFDEGFLDFSSPEKFKQFITFSKTIPIKRKTSTLTFAELFYKYLYSSYERIDNFFAKAHPANIDIVYSHIMEDLKRAVWSGSLQFNENVMTQVGIYCYIFAKYFSLQPTDAQSTLTLLQNLISKIKINNEIQNKTVNLIQNLVLDLDKNITFIYAMVILSGQFRLNEIGRCCSLYLNYEDAKFMCQFIDYEPNFFVAYFANDQAHTKSLLQKSPTDVIEKVYSVTLRYLQNKAIISSTDDLHLLVNATALLCNLIDSKKLTNLDNVEIEKAIFSLIKISLPSEFFSFDSSTHARCQECILAIERLIADLIVKISKQDTKVTANFVDEEQKNLLHYISRRNSVDFVRALLNCGMQLGQRSVNGESAFFALLKENDKKFLEPISDAIDLKEDNGFLEEALLQFYALFNEREKIKQYESQLFVIPYILRLIYNNTHESSNLSLKFGDVCLWELSKLVNDSVLANTLLFDMFQATNSPLLNVLDAINQDNPNYINDCLVGFIKTCWNDNNSRTDYNQLWCYLATNQNWLPQKLIEACAQDSSSRSEFFAERLENINAENDPFELAVQNNNIAFLLLVVGLFKDSNNLKIAVRVGNAAAAMIKDPEDVDLLSPLRQACKPCNYWNLLSFKGNNNSAFNSKVLEIMQKKMVKVRMRCPKISKSKRRIKVS